MNKKLAIAVVLIHILITTPHSIAHTSLQIQMALWQNVFIGVVIVFAPIVAAILVWRGRQFGFTLLALSMAGSFLFGLVYHFIIAGPDNVASQHTQAWAGTFQISAVLLAIVELGGVGIGLSGMKKT